MTSPLNILSELAAIAPYHRRLQLLPQRAPWKRIVYGPHERQYSLVASQPSQNAPIAVYFHGGGWQFGSPELLCAFGEYFWSRGYSVWMPSHRRLPAVSGRAVYADALRALRAVRDHQLALGLPARLLLAGMSSGGHLAALCALRQNPLHGTSIEGLLCCGAPLSLQHLGPSPVRRRFAGATQGAGYAKLDPLAQLHVAPPFPAVVLHGTRDGLVPFASAVAFVNQARAIGWTSLKFVALPGGTHLSAADWVFEET